MKEVIPSVTVEKAFTPALTKLPAELSTVPTPLASPLLLPKSPVPRVAFQAPSAVFSITFLDTCFAKLFLAASPAAISEVVAPAASPAATAA